MLGLCPGRRINGFRDARSSACFTRCQKVRQAAKLRVWRGGPVREWQCLFCFKPIGEC